MIGKDGYIPQSAAAMAVNELFSVIDGGLKLDSGLVEALMASRVSLLKAVDQSHELQRLVEQLVLRVAGHFTDED